jgi:hypothetical protein
MCSIDGEAAARYKSVMPQLEALVGIDKFKTRIEMFEDYWSSWFEISNCQWHGKHENYPACGCKHLSLSDYCNEMDAATSTTTTTTARASLVATRKMMYLLVGCNKYFGMDGWTYDSTGGRIGEEFIARNTPLQARGSRGEPLVSVLDLSQVDRFLQ